MASITSEAAPTLKQDGIITEKSYDENHMTINIWKERGINMEATTFNLLS